MRFSLSLITAVFLALAASGCDRGEQPDSQATAQPTGTIVGRASAGELLPPITVRQGDGTTLALPALAGRPVLINLWATWCAPCVVEMPMLDELAQDGLRVVTISQDLTGAEAVAPFFAARDFQAIEPWLDPDMALTDHYDGGNLPMSIYYDAEGREVWRVIGDLDWTGENAAELLGEAD
ncbi:TlpA family protein disulfide reductase [Pseudoblastomonas halimionae]|uniref:TlpA family protein disulfide reductase n=1 Tax=Alteriqipengyuania halimionae TaxID=1926630 RepID=UPI001F3D3483|nr:TlpA disulfide reductase family protein [Alteriqipengyuania halimionae]